MTASFSLAPRPLAGRVIAVTGADHGYGRQAATALSRSGASVALIGSNTETLSSLASLLEQQGGAAFPIQAELRGALDWLSAQERIMELFGTIDGVVHAADRRTQTRFHTLSETEWMDLLDSNVKSSVAIAQLLVRRMPDTWLTLIGPHLDDADLHVCPQRGALESLVRHAHRASLRANLVLPGRASSGQEAADSAVAETIVALAGAGMGHLSSSVLELAMPPVSDARPERSA